MFFFFNDTATTEIYTLSLHDALPIYQRAPRVRRTHGIQAVRHQSQITLQLPRDRKSTRLNSSHSQISYAVFCLKKKKSPSWLTDLSVHSHPIREMSSYALLSRYRKAL